MFTRYLWWFILTNASIRKHRRLLEVSSLESIGLFGWICHVNMGFNRMKQELLNHWFLGLRWFEWSVPKNSTSVWLFVLNRNPTLDRVQRWGLDVETTCLLCVPQPESRDHVPQPESRDHFYFKFYFSSTFWSRALLKLNFSHSTWLGFNIDVVTYCFSLPCFL